MTEGAPSPAKTPTGKITTLECIEGPVRVEQYTWEAIQNLSDTHPLKVMGLTGPHAVPRQGKEHKVVFLNDPHKHVAEGALQFGAFDSPDVLVSNGYGSCVFAASISSGRASLTHVLSSKQWQGGRDSYRGEWARIIAQMTSSQKPMPFFMGAGMEQQGRFSSLGRIEESVRGLNAENELFDISGATAAGQAMTTIVVMPQERCIMAIRSAQAAENDKPMEDVMKRPPTVPEMDARLKSLLG